MSARLMEEEPDELPVASTFFYWGEEGHHAEDPLTIDVDRGGISNLEDPLQEDDDVIRGNVGTRGAIPSYNHNGTTEALQFPVTPRDKKIPPVYENMSFIDFTREMRDSIHQVAHESIGLFRKDPREYHPFYLRIFKYATIGQHLGYVSSEEDTVINAIWGGFLRFAKENYRTSIHKPAKYTGERSPYAVYLLTKKVVINGKVVTQQRDENARKKQFRELEATAKRMRQEWLQRNGSGDMKEDVREVFSFFKQCQTVTHPADTLKMNNIWSKFLGGNDAGIHSNGNKIANLKEEEGNPSLNLKQVTTKSETVLTGLTTPNIQSSSPCVAPSPRRTPRKMEVSAFTKKPLASQTLLRKKRKHLLGMTSISNRKSGRGLTSDMQQLEIERMICQSKGKPIASSKLCVTRKDKKLMNKRLVTYQTVETTSAQNQNSDTTDTSVYAELIEEASADQEPIKTEMDEDEDIKYVPPDDTTGTVSPQKATAQSTTPIKKLTIKVVMRPTDQPSPRPASPCSPDPSPPSSPMATSPCPSPPILEKVAMPTSTGGKKRSSSNSRIRRSASGTKRRKIQMAASTKKPLRPLTLLQKKRKQLSRLGTNSSSKSGSALNSDKQQMELEKMIHQSRGKPIVASKIFEKRKIRRIGSKMSAEIYNAVRTSPPASAVKPSPTKVANNLKGSRRRKILKLRKKRKAKKGKPKSTMKEKDSNDKGSNGKEVEVDDTNSSNKTASAKDNLESQQPLEGSVERDCGMCGKRFRDERFRWKHRVNDHGCSPEDEAVSLGVSLKDMRKCAYCPIWTFRGGVGMRTHVEKVHPDKCNEWLFIPVQQRMRRQVLVDRFGKSWVKCPKCPLKTRMRCLGDHLKVQHGILEDGDLWKCTACNIKFEKRHLWMIHMKLVHGDAVPTRELVETALKINVKEKELSAEGSAMGPPMPEALPEEAALLPHLPSASEEEEAPPLPPASEQEELEHMSLIDPDGREKCDKCQKLFDPAYLPIHVKANHNVKAPRIPCPACPEMFNNGRSLWSHYCRAHMTEGDLQDLDPVPPELRFTGTVGPFVPRSSEGATNSTSRMCEQCGRDFKTLENLKRHKHQIHGEGMLPENYLQCAYCPKQYKNKDILEEHIRRIHLGTVISTCPHCNRDLQSSGKLWRHMMDNHGVDAIEAADHCKVTIVNCPECKENFLKGRQFANHAKSQHPEQSAELVAKQYKIARAPGAKELGTRQPLLKLMGAESGECPECGLKFTRALGRHRMMQHGVVAEEYFDCPAEGCQAKFKSRTSLRGHMRYYHTGPLEEKIVGKKIIRVMEQGLRTTVYRCTLCETHLFYYDEIKTHVVANHREVLKEEEFKCPHCSEALESDELVRKHAEERHPELLWQCPECEKMILNSEDLSKHFAEAHSEGEKGPVRKEKEDDTDFLQLREYKDLNEPAAKKLERETLKATRIMDISRKYSEMEFKCEVCQKKMLNRRLADHLYRTHGIKEDGDPYVCNVCPENKGQTYSVHCRRLWLVHMHRYHEERVNMEELVEEANKLRTKVHWSKMDVKGRRGKSKKGRESSSEEEVEEEDMTEESDEEWEDESDSDKNKGNKKKATKGKKIEKAGPKGKKVPKPTNRTIRTSSARKNYCEGSEGEEHGEQELRDKKRKSASAKLATNKISSAKKAEARIPSVRVSSRGRTIKRPKYRYSSGDDEDDDEEDNMNKNSSHDNREKESHPGTPEGSTRQAGVKGSPRNRKGGIGTSSSDGVIDVERDRRLVIQLERLSEALLQRYVGGGQSLKLENVVDDE